MSLQVRVHLEGQDHFINRLGRWDDPIAVAKAQAISAEIWRDYREGEGLNMPLATTQAKAEASGAPGTLMGTSMIWTN